MEHDWQSDAGNPMTDERSFNAFKLNSWSDQSQPPCVCPTDLLIDHETKTSISPDNYPDRNPLPTDHWSSSPGRNIDTMTEPDLDSPYGLCFIEVDDANSLHQYVVPGGKSTKAMQSTGNRFYADRDGCRWVPSEPANSVHAYPPNIDYRGAHSTWCRIRDPRRSVGLDFPGKSLDQRRSGDLVASNAHPSCICCATVSECVPTSTSLAGDENHVDTGSEGQGSQRWGRKGFLRRCVIGNELEPCGPCSSSGQVCFHEYINVWRHVSGTRRWVLKTVRNTRSGGTTRNFASDAGLPLSSSHITLQRKVSTRGPRKRETRKEKNEKKKKMMSQATMSESNASLAIEASKVWIDSNNESEWRVASDGTIHVTPLHVSYSGIRKQLGQLRKRSKAKNPSRSTMFRSRTRPDFAGKKVTEQAPGDEEVAPADRCRACIKSHRPCHPQTGVSQTMKRRYGSKWPVDATTGKLLACSSCTNQPWRCGFPYKNVRQLQADNSRKWKIVHEATMDVDSTKQSDQWYLEECAGGESR